MKNVMAYTFRTYPFIQEIRTIFPDVIVLDRLKYDLEKICKKILKEKPSLIIGIANTPSRSTFEKNAGNKFHGTKKVAPTNVELIELTTPKKHPFHIRSQPTNSFCNYSMFTIALFLKENNLNVPFVFTHINQSDLHLLESDFLPFL